MRLATKLAALARQDDEAWSKKNQVSGIKL